jgi:hypothetical protein
VRVQLLNALNAFVTACNAASRGEVTDPDVNHSYVRLANLILSIPDMAELPEPTSPEGAK